MNTFLMMSGWLFWAVILAFVIAEIAAAENESLVAGVAAFLAVAVVITLFSDADPIGALLRHPIVAIAAIPLYFVAGTGWAFWKWRGVIAEAVEKFTERKTELLAEYERSVHKDQPFEAYLRRWKGLPPSAADNKERITTWIVLWPFSMLWALLTYPRKLAVAIYKRLVTTFQRMSDAAFAGKFN